MNFLVSSLRSALVVIKRDQYSSMRPAFE
jgi:hypothetical protein